MAALLPAVQRDADGGTGDGGAREPIGVDIGYHQQAGFAVAVQRNEDPVDDVRQIDVASRELHVRHVEARRPQAA